MLSLVSLAIEHLEEKKMVQLVCPWSMLDSICYEKFMVTNQTLYYSKLPNPRNL